MSDKGNQDSLNLWVIGENLRRVFYLSDKWYVRQMKVFNSKNCRASETSSKLDVRQVACTFLFNWNPRLFLFDKNLPLRHKNDPLHCIKHTGCDMDSIIKLKVFKEMENENGRPGVSLFKFEGSPGSLVPRSRSHFYTMPNFSGARKFLMTF